MSRAEAAVVVVVMLVVGRWRPMMMLESLAAVAVAKLSAAAPQARLGLVMMSRIEARGPGCC